MKTMKNKFIYLLFIIAILFTMVGCGKKVDINFEVNGGETIASVTLKENSDYELPTPTRDSYEFEGWYLNSDFSGEKVTTVNAGSGITVYAKWSQLATITLNLDGGSASVTSIQGKVGETIKSLVKDITPTKSGLKFGSWYVNNNELTDTMKLTEKGVTLKANWLVEYTINVYKQNIAQDNYELESQTLYANVGKKISFDDAFEGFTQVDKEETIDEITLDSDKSKNVINVYFDRDVYTITFRSNYADTELSEETKTVTLVYGQNVTLPEIDFACEGYYLLGWSDKVDGTVLYNAHYIDNLPINLKDSEKKEIAATEITASRNMSLYAIWNKGYNDMFGGNDYIFLTEDDNEVVYLCRGDKYFIGEYYEDDKSFIFYNDNENLEGKIFDDHTFAYYNVTRDEYSATLYEVGTGLVEEKKILFDAYNGITYSEQVEAGKTDDSTGTYIIDENGYYVATFTEGPLAGKTLTIVIGTVTLDDVKSDAFQIRNEEDVELGELVRFVVNNNQLTYYTSAYQMKLSGFGTLSYNTGSSTSTYYYTLDEETQTLTLQNSSGSSVGVAKLMTVNGVNGYMFYTESLDKEFSGENDSKLTLNGLATATYTNNGQTVTGYYTVNSSAFGGYIVTFKANDTVYTFLTNSHTEEKVTGSGEEEVTEDVTVYTFETKPEGYAEYYYKDAEGTYYAPLVVLNDKVAGKASIYGYTISKTFELVLEGSYSYDEDTGLYTFVTEVTNTPEVITSPMDISTITAAVMSLDTTTTKYAISYWYSSTVNEETTNYEVKYTSTDGAKLSLVNGIAIFAKDGYVITGTYATSDGLTTITASSSYVYVEIDEESKTFITLDHAPYNAYLVTTDGQASQKLYVYLDGKGNGTYTYYETESVLKDGSETEYEDQEVKKEIVGTVAKTDKTTKQGYEIYQFTSETKTFKYLIMSSSSTVYMFPYNETVNGEFASNDGLLYIDGFSYYASFTDKDGKVYTGMYYIPEENVILISTEDGYRYFDISGTSFTVRGTEYGTYIEFDNQGAPGNYIALNGYGKAEIFKYEKNASEEYEKVDVDNNATYAVDENGKYTITYKENAVDEVTLIGYLSTYTYSSTTYNTFVIEHKEVVQTFVNTDDWSILKLDAIGNATRYTNKGVKETGTYMLISDQLLYFVLSDSSDANIYTYNMTEGTIVESEFTARGYYTSDLKSLLFSQYGFAIFNNNTRYYYCMRGNNVIIYHQDASNPEANQYGFIEEDFGEFLDVKEYNGDTYYSNDGYAVTFSRKEDTKDNYQVLISSDPETYGGLEELVFTPSGSDTFTVSGTVKVAGTSYSCYVTREIVDEEYVTYITIGYYRFGINVTYGKDGSKTVANYEVISMDLIRSFVPYSYLNTYYYIYLFLGSTYASNYTNNLGTITIHKSFDVDGQVVNDLVDLDFLEGSNAYDLNGTLLANKDLAYEYDETNSYYVVTVTGTDGYTYKVYFTAKLHSAFNTYGYYILAITRCEKLTSGDYEFNLEQIIASDAGYSSGAFFKVALKEGENDVQYSEYYKFEDSYYYIARTKDEETKKITSTTYYKLALVLKDMGSLEEGEEEEESTIVKPYESMTVTKIVANTYYDSEGNKTVDVVDGKIMLLGMDGYLYIVYASEYNAETGVYTITLSSGKQYTVQITDNIATITEVESSENEEA